MEPRSDANWELKMFTTIGISKISPHPKKSAAAETIEILYSFLLLQLPDISGGDGVE